MLQRRGLREGQAHARREDGQVHVWSLRGPLVVPDPWQPRGEYEDAGRRVAGRP